MIKCDDDDNNTDENEDDDGDDDEDHADNIANYESDHYDRL